VRSSGTRGGENFGSGVQTQQRPLGARREGERRAAPIDKRAQRQLPHVLGGQIFQHQQEDDFRDLQRDRHVSDRVDPAGHDASGRLERLRSVLQRDEIRGSVALWKVKKNDC
jgi:hypothetical protein